MCSTGYVMIFKGRFGELVILRNKSGTLSPRVLLTSLFLDLVVYFLEVFQVRLDDPKLPDCRRAFSAGLSSASPTSSSFELGPPSSSLEC